MKFGDLSYDEYVEKIKAFHGNPAPGIIMGGFMVNLAREMLPAGAFFDVFCETKTCLPDAIQLLTPCSVGNGWIKILDLDRFAAVFYDKYTGDGIRIFVDLPRLEPWEELKTWFLKLKPKDMQDSQLLYKQIKEAGTSIFGTQQVRVEAGHLKKKEMGKTKVCPLCEEAFPVSHGEICKGCAGDLPYGPTGHSDEKEIKELIINKTPVEEAVGMHLLHDITKVVHRKEKGPAFRKGHRIEQEDVHALKTLGKNNVYTQEGNPFIDDYIHEEEAARGFARLMKGEGVTFEEQPVEGKIDLRAETDGLLYLDGSQLKEFNLCTGVMCAALPNYSLVKKGDKIAGTRIIPLYISKEGYLKAVNRLVKKPVFKVLPLRKAKVGIVSTGTEVYGGLVEDKYVDIMREKVEAYGCQVVYKGMAPDHVRHIRDEIHNAIEAGADLVITTAGLSVDPDDMTLDAIIEAGAEDIVYSMPVLPGSMTVVARINEVQVMGVPACGLFNEYFSFDILLPRLLANVPVTRKDVAALGTGGLL